MTKPKTKKVKQVEETTEFVCPDCNQTGWKNGKVNGVVCPNCKGTPSK